LRHLRRYGHKDSALRGENRLTRPPKGCLIRPWRKAGWRRLLK
jgi:hypothetical protein